MSDLVAATTTYANGRYRFNIFVGLRTGNYQVKEVGAERLGPDVAEPAERQHPAGETFLDVDSWSPTAGRAQEARKPRY